MDEVWEHIGELVVGQPGVVAAREPKKVLNPEERRALRKRRRRIFGVLDAVAFLLWLAFFIKVFVADIDRLLVGAVAPGLLWLLDLRFFLALAGLALVFLVVRSWKAGGALAYVAFFPFVILFWKIPRFIAVNMRRPAIAFGALNVLTSFIVGLKPAVIALAIACLAGLLILLGQDPVVIAVGVCLMAVLLAVWLVLAIRNGLKPSRFIGRQQKWIGALVSSKALAPFREPTEGLRPENVRGWTTANATQYMSNAGFGLIMHRAAHYWAFSLDQYRTSPSRVIFNGVAILALTVEVALAFAFINFGLYRIDPAQFRAEGTVSFWTFLYYGFAASYFGEIAAVAPVGDFAVIAKIANGVLGSIVILTVVASLFLSYRHARTDNDALAAIEELRSRADSIGEQVGGGFAESIDDLERRLVAIGWGMGGVLNWLGAQVPKGWSPRRN